MPRLDKLLNPMAYVRYLRRAAPWNDPGRNPDGAKFYPPGHFYSPLLDIDALGPGDGGMPFDGPEYWDCVDLRAGRQKAYYEELLTKYPAPAFPTTLTPPFRYYTDNPWFTHADAGTLAGVMLKERPARVVEVGSGFSSAVMLDTIDRGKLGVELTCIDPYPERLQSVMTPADAAAVRIVPDRVQDVPIGVFERLGAGDILFIDSSHVAKMGSDVTHLFLRVLPRLKAGVLVHVHDIFYPYSYPAQWVREGRAWNESLFLRALLVGNPGFEVVAFNCFAGGAFPEVFRAHFPAFLANTGGSIWLRRV